MVSVAVIKIIEVSFVNKRVERIFSEHNKIISKLGVHISRQAMKRINQLRASDDFQSYLKMGIGNPHPLHGTLEGCYGISITGNYRLIIEPENCPHVTCRKTIVKGVCDYHGDKIDWIIP